MIYVGDYENDGCRSCVVFLFVLVFLAIGANFHQQSTINVTYHSGFTQPPNCNPTSGPHETALTFLFHNETYATTHYHVISTMHIMFQHSEFVHYPSPFV
jgi:hypothetical protein